MKTTLLISSFVAASRVGAHASAFCLRRLGIDVILLPTIILGRHPGWGDPGGQSLPKSHLLDMWEAIAKQKIKINAVMTGYLGAEEQIDFAKGVISQCRADNPDLTVLVDPVMGDHGRLYIPENRADAIKSRLLPMADIITPNVWELSYLTDELTQNPEQVVKAARSMPCAVLSTSVETDGGIGALYCDKNRALSVVHEKFDQVPHGGGDSLAACFLAHRLNGLTADEALNRAVSSVFAILQDAVRSGERELPLIARQDWLSRPPALSVTEVAP